MKLKHTRKLLLAAALGALIAPGFAQPPRPSAPAGYATIPQSDEDRIVVTGMVPVPDVGEGAPYYSPDDMKRMKTEARTAAVRADQNARRCSSNSVHAEVFSTRGNPLGFALQEEADFGHRVANTANKAQTATLAAEQARSAAASGKGTMDAVVKTELERQEAVKAYEAAARKQDRNAARTTDLLWLQQRGYGAEELYAELGRLELQREITGGVRGIAPPPHLWDLQVANVAAVERVDARGKKSLYITGQIRNPRQTSLTTPDLAFVAADAKGWPLLTLVAHRERKNVIPAGGSFDFAYEMKPRPDYAHTVVVTFASPGQGAAPRLPVRMFCPGG